MTSEVCDWQSSDPEQHVENGGHDNTEFHGTKKRKINKEVVNKKVPQKVVWFLVNP